MLNYDPVTEEGECGDGVWYTRTLGGVITVYGEGAIDAGAFEGRDDVLCAIIEDGVTGIGDNAFSSCPNLSSVTIAQSVACIGNESFADNENLSEISFPEGISRIGSDAFDGTAWLDSRPDGLIYIGKAAYLYKGTAYNPTLTLKDDTVSIAPSALAGQANITAVILPDTLVFVGEGAFLGCAGLAAVYFAGTEDRWDDIVKENGNDALTGAKLYCKGPAYEWGETVTGIVCSATAVLNNDGLYVITETVAADYELISPAACETDGVGVYTASFTNGLFTAQIKTKAIEKLGHSYGEWTRVDDTKHQRVCANDGAHVETDVHTWDAGVITTPPTVEKEGVRTYTCSICGATKTESVAKLPETAINTDTIKEDGGYVYAASGVKVNELLSAAKAGSSLTDRNGGAPKSDAPVVSGMTLQKADGTKKTVIVRGDNDADGEITAADARYALRVAVKLETPNDWRLRASLIVGGETVTAADARAILRAAVRLEDITVK